MDDTLDFIGDKEKILQQIDKLHEEHRRSKLKELMIIHGWNWGIYPSDESTVSWILALIERKVEIPPELSLGEPFDSAFIAFTERYFHSKYNVYHFLPLLMKHADALPMFLAWAVQARGDVKNHDQLNQMNKLIVERYSESPPSIFACCVIPGVRDLIREHHWEPLDIVYVAVTLDQLGILDGDFRLYHFLHSFR